VIVHAKQKRLRNVAPAAAKETKRVAVYCRQSVEDATSEFGSLQAQREAVEAYVRSQGEKGWQVLDARYDDAGYSGGSLERPAFRQLLLDVRGGRVDVVAVYKIDRLSRSLSDFCALVNLFDQYSVEFVSVTQQFSTTSSAGRLTLNMLASFAQFERETIAERTRDKMQAARRRGMWTGGRVPLGYKLVEHRLVIEENEARTVRAIFDVFLDRGGLIPTLDAMRERGLRPRTGEFDKGTLRRLLGDPWVAGLVRAGDELVPGQHEAIVTRATWDAVQALLAKPQQAKPRGPRTSNPALLAGLLVCGACGSSMGRHFTARHGRHYEAMVCARVLKQGASACPGSRVAMADIDRFVTERLMGIGKDAELLEATVSATAVEVVKQRAAVQATLDGIAKRRAVLDARRANLVDAIAQGGPRTLLDDLRRIEEDQAALDREQADARMPAEVDAAAVRRALAELPGLWAELFPAERARIVRLLVERVVYKGGEVELHMRPGGLARYAGEVPA